MCHSLSIVVVIFGIASSLSGCVVTDIGVSNPLPEVRRVAIAPFINLSTEPDVDLGRRALFAGGFVDRRFAQAYYAELQKTPGFEVIPVGVIDQAIAASGRPMNGPEDYLAIARSIGADAIVVGAVTDFDPYHPRIGLQVQWYSDYGLAVNAPTMPYEREWDEENYRTPESPHDSIFHRRRSKREHHKPGSDCQCEQCIARTATANRDASDRSAAERLVRAQSPSGDVGDAGDAGVDSNLMLPAVDSLPMPPAMAGDRFAVEAVVPANSELLPLYSYTRFFDGRDARLTARLRDYVELSGDMRSGGWEGYLNRSDDFIRFACHVMVNEMFLLHGGESSRRTVFKHRKQLSRKL